MRISIGGTLFSILLVIEQESIRFYELWFLISLDRVMFSVGMERKREGYRSR